MPIKRLRRGATQLQLYTAMCNSNADTVKRFIDGGLDVNEKDSLGNTPLFNITVMSDNPERIKIMELLIDDGADINEINEYGRTLLHNVLLHLPEVGIEKIRVLIREGIDVNRADPNGDTPLHTLVKWCVRHPSAFTNVKILEIVKLLIDNGANLNAVNRSRCTPLDLILKSNIILERTNCKNIIKLLLDGTLYS